MIFFRQIGLCIAAFMFISGCVSTEQGVQSSSAGSDNRRNLQEEYTSAFPTKDISANISDVFRSVRRITISGIYRIFYFEEEPVTLPQIRGADLMQLSSRSTTKEESVAGTAISIAQDSRFISLLTCAHTVQFPDTLIEYVETGDLPENEYIRSVAVKFTQHNLVYGERHLAPFEVKSVDPVKDLALIQVQKQQEPNLQIPPLSIQLGNSKDLKWGSFLYIAGYPRGRAVVTRAIVSDPNRTSRGDFLTDGLFNQGMSGGIILASRDHYSSFEWVGMTNTASAEEEHILVPAPNRSTSDKLTEPYDGPVYQEKKVRIAYGVTQSIPTGDIADFLDGNRQLLQASAVGFPSF